MNRALQSMRRFLCEEEGGQALVLVLSFLIPMVLAFGMVVRTDHGVVAKMQLTNASDAAALAAGNMYSRAMNQVAINNLQIIKVASMQTAAWSAWWGTAAVFYKLFLAEKKWGEWGKLIKAFKCWKKVFNVAWPACKASIQVAIATAETVIGAILAGAVALVSCPIVLISVFCMVCEVLEMAQFVAITEWWLVESGWLGYKGLKLRSEGNEIIDKLGSQSEHILNTLPDEIEKELTRVAKQNLADDAFLCSSSDFREKVRLDVSKTVIPGALGDVASLALFGLNKRSGLGSDIMDSIKVWVQTAAPEAFSIRDIVRNFSATRGATANREPFLNVIGEQTLNIDWPAGMLYFEGPAPDLYKLKFPWGEIYKLTPLYNKAKSWLNSTSRGFQFNGWRTLLQWREVLNIVNSGVEMIRTTSKLLTTENYVPRGPILWYQHWLTSVHFGLADYFQDTESLDEGHVPLGNPDTNWPQCYNYVHPGCDANRTFVRFIEYFLGSRSSNTLMAKIMQMIQKFGGARIVAVIEWIDKNIFQRLRVFKRWLNQIIKDSGCQFLPCNPDWTTYSPDWAKLWADFFTVPLMAEIRFRMLGGGVKMYYLPKDGPQVDFVVAAKKTNQEGFFHTLLPSSGAMGDSNYWAVSKFRLYNPAEVHGVIDYAEPQDGENTVKYYPETMLTQDWRTKLVPVRPDELQKGPTEFPRILQRVQH